MRRIAIVHFNVIELYPPVLNLLSVLEKNVNNEVRILLITNKSNKIKKWYQNSQIKVKRISEVNSDRSRLIRLIKYIYFNLYTILKLIIFRPTEVLYYETHSSYPVYIYKKYFNKKVAVLIHYHEYMTEAEYKNGMVLVNLYHQIEKKFYCKVKWISLTNKYRVEKFIDDNLTIDKNIVNELPNFPPKSWANITNINKKISKPVKIVFVGSLANETMFYEEFSNWVLNHNGEVIWDIYSQLISKDVLEHIDMYGSDIIKNKGFINYLDLNKVLQEYHIGVILYRGHIENFIYNTTNKLFEYLACGLDVWVPEELIGAHDYITENTYPKVVKVDFKNLQQYSLDKLISREAMSYKRSSYFAEDVYEPFIQNYLLK